MKVVIELPDTTRCAFVNYVFSTEDGMSMGSHPIDTDELKENEVKANEN